MLASLPHKLNDPLSKSVNTVASASSAIIQSSTQQQILTNPIHQEQSKQFGLRNPETDHISSSQQLISGSNTTNVFENNKKNLLEPYIIRKQNDENNYFNYGYIQQYPQQYQQQIYSKKLKNKINFIIGKDVPDNNTDNFIKPFSNIKRMSEIYCNENERLKTFQDWPLDFIDKEILAKTGFFFTGDDDKVKCYFCEVEIGRWEQNDSPLGEHTRWSPNCPLLRRRQTNNIPIDQESLNRILPPISYDVCGSNDIIEVRPNAYAEGSINSGSPISSPINSLPNTPNSVTSPFTTSTQQTNFLYPDHPEYAIESARLRSFAEWPRTMKQKPDDLSEAGFFYTGVGDRVKCFSCGGGLKDWDENDDPWEQHALWLANCHYLKLMKGPSYIQSVADKFKNVDEDEESKELVINENNLSRSNSNNSSSSSTTNNSNADERTNNLPSTSSTSSASLLNRTATSSTEIINNNNNNNNKLRSSNSNCSQCSQHSTVTASSTITSDEENCENCLSSLISSSESVSSVNSNSSKEAETVCKQPKLDCHHHHIDRNITITNDKQQQPKKSLTISEEKLCKICYAAEYNTAFLPCGHVVACAKCASSVTKCPMCRKPFTDVMRVYFS